ncbi:MAG: caspase domain-containing protein [Spirosomataceae bacterium]
MLPSSETNKSQVTEKRIALVIGNKNYERTDAALQNPINDANDMAKTLDGLGFDVLKYTDLTFAGFKRAIDEFGEKLPNYDVALFYFSGHGVQFNGENYLVPIDARLQTLSDSEDDCIRLGRIMGKMKAADVKSSLVFLDACRNNPFPKSDGTRGATRSGLIIPNNPAGSVVVFATEEGSTADDNMLERNGLFTSELLRHLPVPNASLSDIILKTRQGVYERSGKNQLPSDYNKMLGSFYFVKEDKEGMEKEYLNLFELGISEVAKNNRAQAITSFQKAQDLGNKHSIRNSLSVQWYNTILTKASRYYQYEEYATALEWYKVAQAINDTSEVREKMNECKTKL